jgi:hypothetical protein
MTNRYRIAFTCLVVGSSLFAVHGSTQSPPTATEAFNLRIKCKKMSDEKSARVYGIELQDEMGDRSGVEYLKIRPN